MSVVSAEEDFKRRRSGTDQNGLKTHSRVWVVLCDDIADGPAVAQDAAGIPGFGSTYEGVAFAGKTADPIDDSDLAFAVTVNYATQSGGSVEVNPLDEPDEIEWGGSESTEPYAIDAAGNPVVNSAGDPIDVERESSIGELTVSRNLASYNDAAMEAYSDTYNTAAVTIGVTTYAVGTLKMGRIRASRQVRNDAVFYRVVFPMRKSLSGFDEVDLADRGFNKLDLDGRRVPILDGEGNPVTTLFPLDGAGQPKANPGDAPATLTFQPYSGADWSALFPDS
ncbi:MAG: hypothetical protein AAGH88_11145 [Planctomycetota bacterium]